jgi:hypothetical protein
MGEVTKLSNDERFESIFNELVTKNYITDEVCLGDATFVIKPLTAGELLEAESVQLAASDRVPKDIVARVRMVSTLSYAILSINGIPVDREKPEDKDGKLNLYKLLMKLPPAFIDQLYSSYLKLVETQNKTILNFSKDVENF